LRTKRAALDGIREVGADGRFALLHDTFHHHLAGEAELFPAETGLVHISGVTDRSLALAAIRDEHRVLVDGDDRLGNVAQIRALMAGGYGGPFSFEPFAPSVHALPDPAGALRTSMAFVTAGVAA
jgi:2-keto-myo-inositol isomerase